MPLANATLDVVGVPVHVLVALVNALPDRRSSPQAILTSTAPPNPFEIVVHAPSVIVVAVVESVPLAHVLLLRKVCTDAVSPVLVTTVWNDPCAAPLARTDAILKQSELLMPVNTDDCVAVPVQLPVLLVNLVVTRTYVFPLVAFQLSAVSTARNAGPLHEPAAASGKCVSDPVQVELVVNKLVDCTIPLIIV